MSTTIQPSPTARARQYWFFGMLAEVKASAAETGGTYTLMEITAPPGLQTPLHVHYREDEAFWILEGSATFLVGEQTIEAGPGDYLFGPRDIPHKFTIGPEGCRMLFICTPGGNFENAVRGMSAPARARTIPPPPDTPPNLEHIAAVARANGCELLM